MKQNLRSTVLLASLAFFALSPAQAAERPALVISNAAIPQALLDKAYSKPAQVREITPEEISGRAYYSPTETMVSREIADLRGELAILQDKTTALAGELNTTQRGNEGKAAEYYAAIATINTQLQAGTTPGNPRLVEKFNSAESSLGQLDTYLGDLNALAMDISKVATEVSFLADAAEGVYSLSGAIEEDHVEIAALEDQVNALVIMVERLLTSVDKDIGRTNAYLSAERDNLRTLSLAISEGNLYGRSLATSGVQKVSMNTAAAAPMPIQQNAAAPSNTPQPAAFHAATGA